MKTVHAIFAAFVCLVTGCATTCKTETFYKPSIIGEVKSTLSWTNTTAFVDLADGLSIAVLECGTAYRSNDNRLASICVQFYIDSGHRLVLADPAVSIQRQTGELIGVGVPRALKVGVEKDSPVVMPHVPIELVGGVDLSRSSGLERAFSRLSGWKRFSMTFDGPQIDAGEVYIELPRMLLDGHEVPVLRFRFSRATEDACHTSV